MNFKWQNLFQVSTLKAIIVLLSATGVTVPIEIVSAISTGVLGLWGVWETVRDSKRSK